MARARYIAVDIARFEHQCAEHRPVLCLLCSFFFGHALGFPCLIEYLGILGGLFGSEGIDESYTREVDFGSDLFALLLVADEHYFGDALLCDFGSRLHDALVLALAQNYGLVEF